MKNPLFTEKEYQKYRENHSIVNKKAKYCCLALLALLGVGAVTTSVVVPIVINNINNGKGGSEFVTREVTVDTSISGVTLKAAYIDGDIEIRLSTSSDYEIIDIESLTINGSKLTKDEYTFDINDSIILIKKDVLNKHSGAIVVKPTLQESMDYNKYFKFTDLDYEKQTCTMVQRSNDLELPSPLNIPGIVKINKVNYKVTSIGFMDAKFKENTDVYIPSTIKTILAGCFQDAKINKVKLSDGLEEIGMCAFYGSSVSSINIPNSLKSIAAGGNASFADTRNLKTVILDNDSDNVLENGSYLLSYAQNIFIKNGLKEPEDTSYIKKSGFGKLDTSEMSGYTQWTVSNPYLITSEGVVSGTTHYQYKENETIPETIGGVTTSSIGERAFAENSTLQNLVLSTNITSIGGYAFEDSSLKQIDLKNVNKIGEYAFSNCKIEKLSLPSGVTSIGGGAFAGCTKLSETTIPSSLTTAMIGNNAWYGCDNLKTVYLDSENIVKSNDNCKYLLENVLTIYINEDITADPTSGMYIYDQGFEKVTSDRNGYNKWILKKNYKFKEISAGSCSIAGHKRLSYDEDLTLPSDDGEGNTVTEIAADGFKQFKNIKNITLPNTITKINNYAFAESSLENIVLNENLTNIGDEVFNWCESLKEITIPSTLNIPTNEYVWSGCGLLKTVILNNQTFTSSTSSCSYLFEPFSPWLETKKVIYIKDNLTEPTDGTYIYDNYAKQDTSDKPGYNKWLQKK